MDVHAGVTINAASWALPAFATALLVFIGALGWLTALRVPFVGEDTFQASLAALRAVPVLATALLSFRGAVGIRSLSGFSGWLGSGLGSRLGCRLGGRLDRGSRFGCGSGLGQALRIEFIANNASAVGVATLCVALPSFSSTLVFVSNTFGLLAA